MNARLQLQLFRFENKTMPWATRTFFFPTKLKVIIQSDDIPKDVDKNDNKTIVFQTVSTKFKDDAYRPS